MRIPLVDLRAQYHSIRSEVLAAIEQVLEHMELYLGPQAQAFEQEFAAYCGCQYGVGVSSGTEALVLALRACGIEAGDEVITVANASITTAEAIIQVGATPTFVDIDPVTYTMDWRQLGQALTPHTRAVIPVHLYGHPVAMQPVIDFAHRHNLFVIENASHAHGATYQDQRVGGIGDIACFSLSYRRNLGAYGEAGICVTNQLHLAEAVLHLRAHESAVRVPHEFVADNAYLDEIQAAILRVKFAYLEHWNAARRSHALFYSEQLQDIVEGIPITQPWAAHTFYLYVVRVNERERFCQALWQQGIVTGIHYPSPVHLQPLCAPYGYKPGSLPVTEAVSQQIVSLPMYAELTPEQLEIVIDAVKRCVVFC